MYSGFPSRAQEASYSHSLVALLTSMQTCLLQACRQFNFPIAQEDLQIMQREIGMLAELEKRKVREPFISKAVSLLQAYLESQTTPNKDLALSIQSPHDTSPSNHSPWQESPISTQQALT